jgi:2-succinyl-5-enolpyruvyl-6-hydroxy-3-cyclohexene-1-carboxylate synthase
LAKHFGFSYTKVDDDITLDRVLENFFKPNNQPKVLEVNTYGKNNADIQKAYFNFLKEN